MTVALVSADTLADRLPDDERLTLGRIWATLYQSIQGGPLPDGRRQLGFRELNRYYEGAQRLEQLGLAVPTDLRQFVTIVAWPATTVDSIEERCDVEGFRLPGAPEADQGLWEIWQANDLDDESHLGHTDSLVYSRSYACVGSAAAAGDPPLITVESPMEMAHEWSPRKRATVAGARFYLDDTTGSITHRATLYTEDATTWLARSNDVGNEWVVEDRDPHKLGRCPVVPLVNRARVSDRYGRSEMERVIPLTDAAARALTNAQVATEMMAMPQRYAAGLTQADFTDPKTGETLTAWESYIGRIWATASKDATFGQFTSADLSNYERIVNHYAQLIAGLTGLPMRFLGQLSANPPSADGIRADEARLIKSAQRKCRSWGLAWETVMRLARHVQTGEDDPDLARMETLWADVATPTRAQEADAAVKLYQAGISTLRQSRRDVGYSSVQIANMEREDAVEAKKAAEQQAAQDARDAALAASPTPAALPTGGAPAPNLTPANPPRPARSTARPAAPS